MGQKRRRGLGCFFSCSSSGSSSGGMVVVGLLSFDTVVVISRVLSCLLITIYQYYNDRNENETC